MAYTSLIILTFFIKSYLALTFFSCVNVNGGQVPWRQGFVFHLLLYPVD